MPDEPIGRGMSMHIQVGKISFAGLLVCVLSTTPVLTQEISFDEAVATPSWVSMPVYPKYCEGKYVAPGGTESIVTVGCLNESDNCICANDGVTCGSRSSPVGGMTLVSGSCKQTFAL